MSPDKLSFTGRIARWSLQYRWAVILITAAVFVVAFYLNTTFGVETSEVFGAGDARKAQELADERFGKSKTASEAILIRHKTRDYRDGIFRSSVESLEKRLRRLAGIDSVTTYYGAGAPFLLSEGGRSQMIYVSFERSTQEQRDQWVPALVSTVESAERKISKQGFEVGIFGETSVNKGFESIIATDTNRVLKIALGAGFVVLLGVFGSLVAALMPFLLGIAAIAATVGAAVPVSMIQPLNLWYYEMVVLIGLAVGVDYSLFVISRYREERRRGRAKDDAILAASDTTGRAVFFAGLSVVLSLAGLVLTRDALFIGLGLGAVIVVLFSVLFSLTLLPVILSFLGDKIEWGSLPRLRKGPGGGGIWRRVVRQVMRRPAVYAATVAVALLAAAVPFFSLHMGSTPIQDLIDWDAAAKQEETRLVAAGLKITDEEFSLGQSNTIDLLVDAGEDGTVRSPRIEAAVSTFKSEAQQDKGFGAPITVEENRRGNALYIKMPLAISNDEERSEGMVQRLREDLVPAAFGETEADVLVTGRAAYSLDSRENVKVTAPLVLGFVLGLAFLILLAMFRSLVIPSTAIVMNLISVGAAYGILVAVFQWGIGESVLNFEATGIVEIFMPLFLFAVLFGLSMDYHMLLLNRIKEAFDSGLGTSEAIEAGITATASQISGAAAIMVLVFGAFAVSGVMIFKQIGLGLGVAVLIDATLIRGVLLPATMKLLGEANWYLPSWLQWIPGISFEATRSGTRAPEMEPAEVS